MFEWNTDNTDDTDFHGFLPIDPNSQIRLLRFSPAICSAWLGLGVFAQRLEKGE